MVYTTSEGTYITCKGMFEPWMRALEACKTDERIITLVQESRITVFEGEKLLGFSEADRDFILSIL
jgi:hypothetical protein